MEKLKKLVRQRSQRNTKKTRNLMAALSFSPSTPPPAAATEQRQQSHNSNMSTSKENVDNAGRQVHMIKTAVTTLGASKPFTKMTVHNVLSESGANALQQHISNQNTIIRKIKDFGIAAAAAAATTTTPTQTPTAAATPTAATAATLPRKRPLGVSKTQNEQNKSTPATGSKRSKLTAKKLLQQNQNQQKYVDKGNLAKSMAGQCPASNAALELISRPAGTPGRKGLPLPQAVARRNARERNRVKQVNNGFAALRERIPEEVSEAFEAQGAGRGASKKLSKVETLRMAVEYIRSLERLLGFDFPPFGRGSNSNSSSSSGDDSFMFIKDEFDGIDEQFDDSLSNYEELEESIISSMQPEQPQQQQQLSQQQQQLQSQEEDLLLPSVTTLNGLQYIRIPGTSTYQLLTPDMTLLAGTSHQDSSSLDDEHFNALIDTTNCMSPAATAATAGTAGTSATANGECVKFDSTTLSRSPVPAAATTSTGTATTTSSRSTSPATTITTATTRTQGSSSLHQPPNSSSGRVGGSGNNNNSSSDAIAAKAVAAAAAAVAVAVSPVAVAVANELLLQACAAQQQQQQQQQLQRELIKQEYSEGDFVHVTNNNNNTSPPAIHDYQQQQQQLLCSPILPAFYDQEPTSFYDNVHIRLPSFKKEFTDVLHDHTTTAATGATTTNSMCLSDESMIDAIDWWEAHTPKSDVGTIAGM